MQRKSVSIYKKKKEKEQTETLGKASQRIRILKSKIQNYIFIYILKYTFVCIHVSIYETVCIDVFRHIIKNIFICIT